MQDVRRKGFEHGRAAYFRLSAAGRHSDKGAITVRIDDRDSVEVPVGRFDQTTFHDVVAYLTDLFEQESFFGFFGFHVNFVGQRVHDSMMNETLEYFGIDNGATLHLQTGRPSTRDEVERILQDRGLANGATYDEHGLLKNLNLGGLGLTSLPGSFGQLRVGGDLNLIDNDLTSLPESFGQLRVEGDLDLAINGLRSLPESFGQLRVGGSLYVGSNPLTSLPESFSQLRVGGDLGLGVSLTRLPESFGQLRVGGDLELSYNELTSLPKSFGLLRVGGDLLLDNNQLTTLPEGFGQLIVGGNVFLDENKLTTLPQSFGQVGGKVYLHYP